MCSQLLQSVSKEFIADIEMQYFPHDSQHGLFRLCTLVFCHVNVVQHQHCTSTSSFVQASVASLGGCTCVFVDTVIVWLTEISSWDFQSCCDQRFGTFQVRRSKVKVTGHKNVKVIFWCSYLSHVDWFASKWNQNDPCLCITSTQHNSKNVYSITYFVPQPFHLLELIIYRKFTFHFIILLLQATDGTVLRSRCKSWRSLGMKTLNLLVLKINAFWLADQPGVALGFMPFWTI